MPFIAIPADRDAAYMKVWSALYGSKRASWGRGEAGTMTCSSAKPEASE